MARIVEVVRREGVIAFPPRRRPPLGTHINPDAVLNSMDILIAVEIDNEIGAIGNANIEARFEQIEEVVVGFNKTIPCIAEVDPYWKVRRSQIGNFNSENSW